MRVVQTSPFLLDIIRDAAAGKLGVPPFQRSYAWEQDDVEKLMKSLLRRWPLGSFTIWTPDDPHSYPSKGRLGPIETTNTATSYLLDGQNRLASIIYASFLHQAPVSPDAPYSEREVDTWINQRMVLAADAEKKTIAFYPRSESLTTKRVPLSFVLDATIFKSVSSRELIKCIDSVCMEEVDVDWIFSKIPDAIRAARVTCTELCNASFEEAKECYMTICKTGQPISEDELDRAFNYNTTLRAEETRKPSP